MKTTKSPHLLAWLLLCAGALLLRPCKLSAQGLPLADLRTLNGAGAHPASAEYFSPVIYANAVFPGHDAGTWIEFDANGSPFTGPALPTFQNSRCDANGYPRTLAADKRLGINPWSLNTAYQNRPAAWPRLVNAALGQWMITWKGRGDVRLSGGSPQFLEALSRGTAAEGLAVDGTRVYLCATEASLPNKVIVHSLDAANPITDLRVWLPDPADPMNRTLERPTLSKAQRLYHPAFIARLKDAPGWKCIRMMDLGGTNNSPQKDWADRRLPDHVFPTGVLNPRDVMEGLGSFVLGNQVTGMPFEHMVALCNESGKNLWINIPHLATRDFMTKLARLIQFGSDGVEPYLTTNAQPVWPPLRADLKVIVEYSNEIWNTGTFAQGVWAQAAGVNDPPEFIAQHSADAWQRMEAVLGTTRVIRAGAIQTGNPGGARELLAEWRSEGVEPEMLAVTTYFGQNLQYHMNGLGLFNGKSGSDPYWTSPVFQDHLNLAFDKWEEFLLTGTAAVDPFGSGDTLSAQGGLPDDLVRVARESGLPLIAYEGGTNFFTNRIDTDPGAQPENSAITIFMEALNRHPRMAKMERIHLEMARSKGLWMHMPFQLASTWGRFGQWGHLETMDQNPAEAVKYQAVRDWAAEHATLRHPDDPSGSVPQFDRPARLPLALAGRPYFLSMTVSGGTAPLTVSLIASRLPAGLSYNESARTITGTPSGLGEGQLFLRVQDAQGDPAWRLFTLRVVAPGSVVDLEAVADAEVVQFGGNAGSNFGSRTGLQVVNPVIDLFGGPPDGAKSYLKFDLGSLTESGLDFSKAEVVLTQSSSAPVPASPAPRVVLYATDNAWQENTITFSNRPAPVLPSPLPPLSSTLILPGLTGGGVPMGQDGVIRADITAHALTAGPLFSVVVAAERYPSVSVAIPELAAREHENATLRPRLRLTVAPPPRPPLHRRAPAFSASSRAAAPMRKELPAL